MPVVITPVSTHWTGGAGNGLWSEPANWSNGVPPSGAPYANGNDDLANLDNSVATTPFTVTIDGQQAGDIVNVNLSDPVGAPAIRLVGTLDLANNVSPGGGFGLGSLNLDHGTFEVDGGTLRDVTVEQGGEFGQHNGAITFGPSAGGVAHLQNVGIENEFTIANGSLVEVDFSASATFEKDHAASHDTVTIVGNSALQANGTLVLRDTTVDVQQGSFYITAGLVTGDTQGGKIVEEGNQALQVIDSSEIDQITVDGDITVSGSQTVVLGVQNDLIEKAGGTKAATFDLGSTVLHTNILDVFGGTTTLSNVLIENGAIQLESDGTLALAPNGNLGGFKNLTITAADTSAPNPTVIDLGGGSYTVEGNLTLNNVVFANGTLSLAADAEIIVHDQKTSSVADFINVSVPNVTPLTGQTVLTGTPDVHVTASTILDLQNNAELIAETGADGGQGTFFIDAGPNAGNAANAGVVRGSGLVLVDPQSGGPSSMEVDGVLNADVSGGQLFAESDNWTVGYGGLAEATNGGTLIVGNALASPTSVSDLQGGILKSYGTFDANNGIVFVSGDAPVATLAAHVVLEGSGLLLTQFSTDGTNVSATSLQSSLTSIGASLDNFRFDFGTLDLRAGQNFVAAHAIDLFDTIQLSGAVFDAPAIHSHASFFGSGIQGQIAFGTIKGSGTVDGPIDGTVDLVADGGTLVVNGSLQPGSFGGNSALRTDDAATSVEGVAGNMIMNGDLASAEIFDLGAGTTISLRGGVASGDFLFYFGHGDTGGSTLDLTHPAGLSMNLFLGGANTTFAGNKIHLEGAVLNRAPGTGTGLDLVRTSASQSMLTVHMKDDSGNVLADDVFTINGNLDNIGVTANSDGVGGTILTFGDNSQFAKASVTVPTLPNVHVGIKDEADLTIFNTSSGNSDQGNLNGSVGEISGTITATGAFTDLQPGHSTAELDTFGSGSPITVGVDTSKAGLIAGTAEVILDSVASSAVGDVVTATKTEYVDVSAKVYDFAHASFPSATLIEHRSTDPDAGPTTLALSVSNDLVAIGSAYQEELNANITGVGGDFTSDDTSAGVTHLVAGVVDKHGLTFLADTSEFAKSIQLGTINVHLVSDGIDTSGLGVTDQGTSAIDVKVELNDFAAPTIDGHEIEDQPAALDPGPIQKFTIDLGTFQLNSVAASHYIEITNREIVEHEAQQLASRSVGNTVANELEETVENDFTNDPSIDTALNDTLGGGGSGSGGGGGGGGGFAKTVIDAVKKDILKDVLSGIGDGIAKSVDGLASTSTSGADLLQKLNDLGGPFGSLIHNNPAIQQVINNLGQTIDNAIKTETGNPSTLTPQQLQSLSDVFGNAISQLQGPGAIGVAQVGSGVEKELTQLDQPVLEDPAFLQSAINDAGAGSTLTEAQFKGILDTALHEQLAQERAAFETDLAASLASDPTEAARSQHLQQELNGLAADFNIPDDLKKILQQGQAGTLEDKVQKQLDTTTLTTQEKADILNQVRQHDTKAPLPNLEITDLKALNDFVDQPETDAAKVFDDALTAGQDALFVNTTLDPAETNVATFLPGVRNPLQPGHVDKTSNVINIDTSRAADYKIGVIFQPLSVNATDPGGVKETPIEIVYSYSVTNQDPIGGGWGDPHLTTFDGLHYDFQGAGDFIFTESTKLGDNFEVQVRAQPIPGTVVSLIHEVAVETGAHRVTLDADRANAGTGELWIDGARVDIATGGTLNLFGGGSVHHVDLNDYVVTSNGGEITEVTGVNYLNVTVQLGVNGPKSQVQGLLGNAGGDFNKDLQLADPAHPGQFLTPGATLTYAQLYTDANSLANTWRVTSLANSLLDYAGGQTPDTFNIATFPLTPVTAPALPSSVIKQATAAVDAAGITDATLRADAILDFALTGDTNVIQNALTQQQTAAPTGTTASLTVTNTPAATVQVGLAATAPQFLDNTSASGQIYLTGPLTTAVTVSYAVVDPGTAGYLTAANFGGTLPTGSVTIQAGQTASSFQFALSGIGNDVSDHLRVAITGIATADQSQVPATVVSSIDFQVVNHASVQGIDAQPAFIEFAGGGNLVQVDATHWTLDLGSLSQASNAPVLALGVTNAGPSGADLLSGNYTFGLSGATEGSFTTQKQTVPTNLAAGQSAGGLQILANPATLGSHSETVTLNPTQANASGFNGALAPITLTITDNVVATPVVTIGSETLAVDSGASATDRITSDGRVTLTGTASGAGALAVEIFDGNGVDRGAATVNPDGTWTFTTTLPQGSFNLHAQLSDGAAHVASSADAATIQVDATAPVLTAVGNQILTASGTAGATAIFVATSTDNVDGSDPVVFKEGNNVVTSGRIFAVGTHTITASATDVAGNVASEQFTIDVKPQLASPPVLSIVPNQTNEATGPAGAVAAFAVTVTDVVDGTDPVVFMEGNAVVHSGDTFAIGTHTITASATNTQGSSSSETFIIKVQDSTAPTLTAVVDQTDEATGATGAQATFAATATDLVDGIDQVLFKEGNVVVHSGDTFAIGTHTITVSATDVAGNTSSEQFTIKVQDTTAPTLTAVANQTDEATGATGAQATFAATATDLVDGADQVLFKEGNAVVHSGDTFAIGTHTITASATDVAGNTSSEQFTIKVQDTTAPTLTTVVNQTDEATGATGAQATFAATATDLVDGTDQVVFKEGNVVVHSGDTFAIGTHTITASATDVAGNTSSEQFTIKVQDTTAPTLTAVANQTDEATGATGAKATFAATATDLLDGTDQVVFKEGNVVVQSGDTFAIGTHTITASATDVAGNTSSEQFTIKVQDTTAPTLTLVANQTIVATSTAGAVATFAATATDLVDGTDLVLFKEGNVVVHSGDTFGIGTHTITASAVDAAGNASSEQFTISVLSQPIVTFTSFGGLTNQSHQNVTGTVNLAFVGSTVTVFEGANPLGSAVVQNDGTWKVAVTLSGDGQHTLVAKDTVGNVTGSSTPILFNLDTITTESSIADPAVTTGTDGKSYINAAHFNGGVTTLTGTAENGDAIVVKDAANHVVGTTTANAASGAWSVNVSGLTSGQTYSYTATATDAAGNSAHSASFGFTVKTSAPAPVVQAPLSGSSTTNADPTISGLGEAGDTLTVKIDGAVSGTTTVLANGSWSFVPPTALTVGSHSVVATEVDFAGNVSASSNTDIFTVAPHITLTETSPAAIIATVGVALGFTGGNAIAITDGNVPGETYKVTVSDSVGSLSASGPGITGIGTHSLTITGSSVSQVNTELASLTYTNTNVGSDAIIVTASDSNGSTPVTKSINVTVNPTEIVGTQGHFELDGTSYADHITPDSSNFLVRAGAGNDVISLGAYDQSFHFIDGGPGNDTLDLSHVGGSVVVSLGGSAEADDGRSGYFTGSQIGGGILQSVENVIGGTGHDILIGSTAANRLQAGTGSTTMTGNGGGDTFVFKPNFGKDVITDFHAADTRANQHDVIEISKLLFADWNALESAITNKGHDAVITYDASDTITLNGVTKAQLIANHLSDFHFV